MGAAAFCCMMMTAAVTTSCGDDDSNDSPVNEVKNIETVYQLRVTEQMAEYCKYTVTYYGDNNELKTEEISFDAGPGYWEKKVSSSVIPAKVGMRVSATVRPDVHLDETVEIHEVCPLSCIGEVYGYDGDKQIKWQRSADLIIAGMSFGIKGNALAETLAIFDRDKGGLINHSYSFDKLGKSTSLGKIK